MGAFTFVTMLVVPITAGVLVMNATNPELDEATLKARRAATPMDARVVSDVNKKRLAMLLNEVKQGDAKGGETRYKAALDGRTTGTTTGSSKGVRM